MGGSGGTGGSGATGGGKEFEIAREFEVDASPRQVWDALTTGTAGWLWPMEYEPRVGGAAPFGGTVVRWDPPRRLVSRTADAGVPGLAVQRLDHAVEPCDGGRRSRVRYVHSGVFTDDWDVRYDAAARHTDFHLHTLGEYLRHFAGRPAAFTTLAAPGAAARAPDAFARLARELGIPEDAAEGARVRVEAPGGPLDAVVDFRSRHFLGLRTDDALHRFFGRNHFGAPVALSVHDFAPHADAKGTELAWRDWLESRYA